MNSIKIIETQQKTGLKFLIILMLELLNMLQEKEEIVFTYRPMHHNVLYSSGSWSKPSANFTTQVSASFFTRFNTITSFSN